jgi:hypothetical protein
MSLQDKTRLNEIRGGVQTDQLRSASWEQRGSRFICCSPGLLIFTLKLTDRKLAISFPRSLCEVCRGFEHSQSIARYASTDRPQSAGHSNWIDAAWFPPRQFIANLMILPVVSSA